MNKVILSGTIEKDFDIKSTSGGKKVTTLSLKCYNDETKKSFLLINCVFWAEKAETISAIGSKGDYIEVEGKLSVNSYKGNNNQTLYKTEVVVDRFELVGNTDEVHAPNYTPQQLMKQQSDNVLIYDTEDLPF